MEFISTKEASELWGISSSRIVRLCSSQRIPGATLVGKSWLIPKNAQKPLDARRKEFYRDPVKKKVVPDSQSQQGHKPHFPLLSFNNYTPEIIEKEFSEDEKLLYKAQKLADACEIDEAYEQVNYILKTTKDIYVRIGALYIKYILHIFRNEPEQIKLIEMQLDKIFTSDFEHKHELEFVIYDLQKFFRGATPIKTKIKLQPSYKYEPDFLDYLAVSTSMVEIIDIVTENGTPKITPYEVILSLIKSKNPMPNTPQILMHCYIGIMYGRNDDPQHCLVHINKALEYSMQTNNILQIIIHSKFIHIPMEKCLPNFPIEFQEKVRKMTDLYNKNYVSIISQMNKTNLFYNINDEDLKYISYITKNLTNKEITQITGLSESSISKKYSALFRKVGVSSKKELAHLYAKNLFNYDKI